jgi:nucleobase:cation symporter-1, NCS1 family
LELIQCELIWAAACALTAPALRDVSAFAWFIGAGLGVIIHYALADRSATFADVSGESIAVESVH